MFERVKRFFQQFREQGFGFIKELSLGRKISLALVLAMCVFLLVALSLYSGKDKYVVMFSDVSMEEQSQMLAQFSKNNIKDVDVQGDSILVPKAKLQSYRMLLAEAGLPHSGSGVGWEKFDEQNFGLTEFEQRVHRLRALQGELSRTINSLEPVKKSRVHIPPQERSIFGNDGKSVTASVFLHLKQGQTLSKKQLKGIIHLVANAVENLSPKNIAVIDQYGSMLTEVEKGDFDKISDTQLKYKNRMENILEGKIREILRRFVGSEKVVAQVTADIDVKKVSTVVEDIDPDRIAVSSQQRQEQKSSGNGLNPTGVPGAKSNLPTEDAQQGVAGSSQQSTQTSETVNYDMKKTRSKIVEPSAILQKLSVSVLVDGIKEEEKFTPRSKEEIEKITSLVKNAIGFSDKRGDSITVESVEFELDEVQRAEKETVKARTFSLVKTGILSLAAVAAMVFVYFAAVKPYFTWLTFDPNKRAKEDFQVADYELERSGMQARKVQVEEETPFEKLSTKEQIFYLARNDPDKTTEAIRQFLSPGNNGG